jgi:hypothetical protein
LPAPLNQLNNGLEKWLTQKFPDSKGAVGYLASNVAATILTKRQDQEVFQQLGWNPTSGGVDAEFNALGETTWVPIATNLKQKGVKGLVWVGTPENLVALEQAMQAINYKPEWIFGGINGYDPALQKGFKTTPLPTYLPLEFAPFEYANQHTLGGTAIHQYLELFQKYLPKGKSHAALGINSFASWLLFAQAAKACGANLTPKCMYGQMQKTTKFNAGGLTGQSEIATQAPTQCFTATQAVLGGFKVVDVSPNTDVYNCSPSNIATLTGDYGKGTTLASVGKSVNDLK